MSVMSVATAKSFYRHTTRTSDSTAMRDFPCIIANPEPRQGSLSGTPSHDKKRLKVPQHGQQLSNHRDRSAPCNRNLLELLSYGATFCLRLAPLIA